MAHSPRFNLSESRAENNIAAQCGERARSRRAQHGGERADARAGFLAGETGVPTALCPEPFS